MGDRPNVRDGEPENEGPDHAEDELEVPVDNVCSRVKYVLESRGRWVRRPGHRVICRSTSASRIGGHGLPTSRTTPQIMKRTFWANIGELYASRRDEFQSFIHVLGFLDPQTRSLVVSPKRHVA